MIRKFENKDCMEGMKEYPDKYFDLAIVDPPYFKGPGEAGFYGQAKWKAGTSLKREYKTIEAWNQNIPKKEYFDELLRVSKNQIIWGINYYDFIHCVGRIIWDKKNDFSTFSKCEIASCSKIKTIQIFRYKWNGMFQEDMKNKEFRIHPTQKPIALYRWILQNYAKPGDLILDTHVGSASSLIACEMEGFDYVGFEIDPHYYKLAVERIKRFRAQQDMFTDQTRRKRVTIKQEELEFTK